MSVTIPDQAKGSLKRLLALSAEQRRQLIARVRATKPDLQVTKWASSIAEHFGPDKKDIEQVVWMLTTLYLSRSPDQTVESLVDDVRRAAERSGDDELARASWDDVKPDLAALLSEDDTLGVTAKALDVMMQVERNFMVARIMTDLRPVFGGDVTPAAGVVIHQLVVTYIQDGEDHDVVFALDGNDIQALRAVLDRAARKEASLKTMLGRVQLPILEATKR